jgi:hypothetical protein
MQGVPSAFEARFSRADVVTPPGRTDTAPLVAQLRMWIETPRINEALLSHRIFTSALELGRIHEDLDQYNPRGLAMITQRLLSNRYVRRRILALAPDRKLGRKAMDALRAWADVAAANPKAKGN